MSTPPQIPWAPLGDKPIKIVFIAGPYIGDGTPAVIAANIKEAESYAVALANHGIGFFCPHLHTHHFETKARAEETFYHALDFHFLTHADAILLTPRWQSSSGARRERDWALAKGLPVFYPDSPSPQDMYEIVVWNGTARYGG
jgi:hypothetical protein